MSSDKDYVNLLLWQMIGSTLKHSTWCASLGLLFQGLLLGVTLSQAQRYFEHHALSDLIIMVTGGKLAGVIINLGITGAQTHRLLTGSSDYGDIIVTDLKYNISRFAIAGLLWTVAMGHHTWRVWEMAGSKRYWLCSPLVPVTLAVTRATIPHGISMTIVGALLVRLCASTPSLGGTSRTTLRTLPALALMSVLGPLNARRQLQAIVESTASIKGIAHLSASHVTGSCVFSRASLTGGECVMRKKGA
ncbi:hypothetical protein IAR50_005508 [Cryptococcus sp. DSM 104548]